MSILEYILLSGTLTLPMMYAMHSCTFGVSLRLSRGLAIALVLALEQSLLAVLGLFLGSTLSLNMAEYDKLIFLGLMVVVAVRMIMSVPHKKKEKEPVVYDITRWGTVLLLGIARGTNAFLAGLGAGFIATFSDEVLSFALPVFFFTLIFSYWGVMSGRQQFPVHPRRWVLLSTVALLVITLKVAL